MNSLVVLLIGAVALFVGYKYYAGSIDRDIVRPDAKKACPAKMYMDGVDFIPASRNVLFGYQFKSIAALGPITGPIAAVAWGWAPALAWVILGTFFIGWVQDYGAMMMGVRRDGDTLGALSYKLISPRARSILMLFLYFYLLLIMGSFGNLVGKSLMARPVVPFGMIMVTLAGIIAGQMTYKMKKDIVLTTLVTVAISFVGIWLSTLPAISGFFTSLFGGAKSPVLFMSVTRAQFFGTLMVLLFCYLGSVLPIWSWAQPVNYVSFWIIGLGMLGGILGLLIWHPTLGGFPAYTQWTIGMGPLWPMLFVTIACGAISGWHSLVSTSGTARQLECETDALPVGGGAMFLEMILAIISILTATAGMGGLAGYQATLKSGAALGVFAEGLANFLSHIGIPKTFGVAYGSVFLTIMGLTIMQLAVRFMRVASAELLGNKVPVMKNVHVGTLVALILTAIFVWIIPWLTIWTAFGGANQLMAGLALLLVALWLKSEGRKNGWALYPSFFMLLTTFVALILLAVNQFKAMGVAKTGEARTAALLVGLIAVVLLGASVFLISDGLKALRKKAQA